MRANEFINKLPNENSLGQSIANNPEALKNFWNWFGDSKVVDSQGRPLVVYHGTKSDISEFIPSRGGEYGSGIYLTNDEGAAWMYADRATGDVGQNVTAVYASIQKPLITRDREVARSVGMKKMKSQGYDGIIAESPMGERQYIAFDPTQIKSTIGNNGNFNPTNPSIVEARKNPDQNPKEDGHIAAYKKIKQMIRDGTDPSTIGISMTDIPKLGINPQSGYDTPIGIYFYPCNYYLERISNNYRLPFQHGAPYIQIFTFDNSDTIDTNKFRKPQLIKSIDKMSHIAKKLDHDLQAEFNVAIDTMSEDALAKSNAGMFWYLTLTLSNYLMNGSKLTTGNSVPVMWNKLLRKLGYSAIVDTNGIIHKNEPTQGVIFDPRIILSNYTIHNTTKLDDKSISVLKGKNAGEIKEYLTAKLNSAALGAVRYKQLENAAIRYGVPLDTMVTYAWRIGLKRWKELEPILAKPENIMVAYEYAEKVLRDPDPRTWQQRYRDGKIK